MIFNPTGSGGGMGATLTVTAPAGCTVTVSKDGKTKTKTADSSGVTVFKGLATGEWTLTIADGSHTVQKTVTITADYAAIVSPVLFDYGNQNYTWTAEAVKQSSAADGVAPAVTENEDGSVSVKLTKNDNGVISGGYISEPVDLSLVDTIFIDFTEQKSVNGNANSSFLCVMPVDYASVDESCFSKISLTGKQSPVSLDVNNISGMCRVLVQLYINTYAVGTGYVNITVKRVWGE